LSSLSPLSYLDVIARAGSIRRAAETLSITSTALNRRLLALETELGAPLFERGSRGVRLSAAGELIIRHVRNQISDIERVKSQISELKGERRGRVAIASSQAFLPYFLPSQIAIFRAAHPGVTFTVLRREREAAEQALLDYSADIALVVEPVSLSVMNAVVRARQGIHAVMRSGHPLAEMQTIRLGDCIRYPIALPTSAHGVRQLVDLALAPLRRSPFVAVESDSFDLLRNYGAEQDIVTFQIPIGLPSSNQDGLVHRPVDQRDLQPADVFVGHLRDRVLPSAAASFLEQIGEAITAARD
jgi:DNA-binding transcriptional LysR family regulator